MEFVSTEDSAGIADHADYCNPYCNPEGSPVNFINSSLNFIVIEFGSKFIVCEKRNRKNCKSSKRYANDVHDDDSSSCIATTSTAIVASWWYSFMLNIVVSLNYSETSIFFVKGSIDSGSILIITHFVLLLRLVSFCGFVDLWRIRRRKTCTIDIS